MELILQELSAGLPDAAQTVRIMLRMLAAVLLGAVRTADCAAGAA